MLASLIGTQKNDRNACVCLIVSLPAFMQCKSIICSVYVMLIAKPYRVRTSLVVTHLQIKFWKYVHENKAHNKKMKFLLSILSYWKLRRNNTKYLPCFLQYIPKWCHALKYWRLSARIFVFLSSRWVKLSSKQRKISTPASPQI